MIFHWKKNKVRLGPLEIDALGKIPSAPRNIAKSYFWLKRIITKFGDVWKKFLFRCQMNHHKATPSPMTIGSVFWLVTALIHYQSTRWTHWDVFLWLLFVLKTPSARRLPDTHRMAPGHEVREGWRGHISTHCSRSKQWSYVYCYPADAPFA